MITINLDKAKTIAHTQRRIARSAEFAPLDIKATIPSESETAELARAEIRSKYTTMQIDIEEAVDVATLKSIVEAL